STTTACTRWRASTTPFRTTSTWIGSTAAGYARGAPGDGDWPSEPRPVPGTAYGCVTKVSQLRRGQLRRDRHVCIVDVVPREPRDTAAGFFHLYAHCVWATDRYFRDDVDRMVFLRARDDEVRVDVRRVLPDALALPPDRRCRRRRPSACDAITQLAICNGLQRPPRAARRHAVQALRIAPPRG